MPFNAYDHLIIGSTPLAGLTAGLLAHQHGRRVCLVARPYSRFALERRFDLSIDLVNRPETLALLGRLTAETLTLLNDIGKNLVERAAPLFIGESTASATALAHFRHLAGAFGLSVERVGDPAISAGEMLRIQGQHTLAHHRFAPALEAWLAAGDVRQLDLDETPVTLRKDGSARLRGNGVEAEAQAVLLADDEAILTHLSPETWDRSLVRHPATALLLRPTRPFPEPLTVWLDRGLVLRQEPKAVLSAVALADRDGAEARIASAAPRAMPLRRAGEVRFEALTTADGAPLLAAARGSKAMHLAGFGLAAAFYAPALARAITDRSTPQEAAWFASRVATRGNLRLNAAEFA